MTPGILFRKLWWLLPVVAMDIAIAWTLGGCSGERMFGGCGREKQGVEAPVPADAELEPVDRRLVLTYPTAQTNLYRIDDPTVYMSTGSGRLESALYGSVRTGSVGGLILPTFHEGIDIAPMQRDRRGRALDPVMAIADGTVVYATRVAGNSNYGIYVVIEHLDAIGPVYSLYAHLASVQGGIRAGVPVAAGTHIGKMGHTSTMGVPVSRSHLHLEMGLMLNRRYEAWSRKERLTNPHGRFHGWNLTGISPQVLYPSAEPVHRFSVLDHVASLAVAFEVLLNAGDPLDYFAMYPALWCGEGNSAGAIVLFVSENGIIFRGRKATDDEAGRLGGASVAVVLSADKNLLGRNGMRLISERRSGWELTSKGKQWLEILTF